MHHWQSHVAIVLASTLMLVTGCAPVQVSTSTEINRSASETWAVFADSANLGSWMHASWDRGKMHWADADASSIGVPMLVRLGEDGEEMEMLQTIVAIEQGTSFQYTFEHDWADTDFQFFIDPEGDDACTVRCDFTAHPKGVHGLWMSAARSSMRDRFDGHLAKLKALVEAGPNDQ